LGDKTQVWVSNAVKTDNFEPSNADFGVSSNSSSVTDIFTVIYEELDFISDLGWSNAVQNAGFMQKFAKVSFSRSPVLFKILLRRL
jgi:hypothetical protein